MQVQLQKARNGFKAASGISQTLHTTQTLSSEAVRSGGVWGYSGWNTYVSCARMCESKQHTGGDPKPFLFTVVVDPAFIANESVIVSDSMNARRLG